MPQDLTGSNVYSNTISGAPSAGDPAAAAVVRACLQVLLNNSVNAKTEEQFKVDTRGTTSGLTGNISLTGAGRTITLGTEFVVLGVNPLAGYESVVTIVAPEVTFAPGLPGGEQVVSFKGTETWLTSSDTFIGSGSSQSLTVEATTTFGSPVTCTDDVTVGNSSSDTLEVNARANFNSNVDVDGTLTVDSTFRANGASLFVGNADVQGTLNASGDVTLGNSSGDAVAINGTLAVSAEASFDSPVTVDSSATIGNSSSHEVTINGQLTANRDITLGNSSSDDLEINAQLTTPFLCKSGSAGRVPGTISGTVTSNTTIAPVDGQLVMVNMASPASNRLIIDETGRVNGDQFWICNRGVSSYVLQLPNGNTHTVTASQNVHMHFRDSFWYVAAYNTAFIDIG